MPLGAAEAVEPVWAGGLEVLFLDQDGEERRGPLPLLWNVSFERVRAVREFVSFEGQSNFAGLGRFSRAGDHVGV